MKSLTTKNNFLFSNLIALGSAVVLVSIISSVIANPLEKLSDQWYVGGSMGFSDMDPDGGDTWKTKDGKGLSKKIYIGTDISRQIGLEAFWADFGEAKLESNTGDTGKVHYQAIGANVVYNSPVKFLGLRPLGKLGVAKFSNKDKGAVNSQQNNKLTVFGSIGAEFDLTENLTLRSKYEYFDKDISNMSVGVNWSPKYRDHSFISQQNRIQKQPTPVKKVPDNNIVNVFVPQRAAAKPQPIVIQRPRPKVIHRPAPPPTPQYKIVHKTLSGGSHFDSGSAQLTPDGRNTLNRLAQDLSKQTIKSIRIVGHTDSIGSSQSNLSLSYARANSVAAYLASRGVNRQLINTQGLGETRPVANNRTTRGRALNRRVEITVKGAARIRIR